MEELNLGDLFWQGRVPKERWGRDHISTLLYLETRIVDHAGLLAHRHAEDKDPHMRTAIEYPTRLVNPTSELRGHTDYDCIRDFIAEGLVLVENVQRIGEIEDGEVIFSLTSRGWEFVGAKRRERALLGKASGVQRSTKGFMAVSA